MQQLNFQGKTKEQLAIEFIREHEPPEGYFLGFSGGKDSTVLYDLTKKSGVKFQAYYSATGIDAPEVVKFIKEKYPEVIFLRPTKSFYYWIGKTGYGFPTRIARWCCNKLKKDQAQKISLRCRLMGIRSEESTGRAKRGKINDWPKRHQKHFHPIFDWLEWEVWDYIEAHGLPYCSLYDEGFSRIGCVVCPFHSYSEHQKYRARWPKFFVAFDKAMKHYWDRGKKDGTPFRESTFEEFLSNWYKGK
ncbi:MAG: phosphoadenosine phosphosulfate reductase family protein [Magnetococcus sp. WYHC-3]